MMNEIDKKKYMSIINKNKKSNDKKCSDSSHVKNFFIKLFILLIVFFSLAIVCKENTTDFDWNKIIDIIENRDTLLMVDFVRFDKLNNGKFKDNILRDKKVL